MASPATEVFEDIFHVWTVLCCFWCHDLPGERDLFKDIFMSGAFCVAVRVMTSPARERCFKLLGS